MKKDDKSKDTLSSLSKGQLNVLASDIRADILSACLNNGGHLSSNLGVVELTIALLRHFDYLTNDILFDVGHQSYTYKILTGRKINNIRRTGGTAPFNLREESPYDRYSNGHAGDCLGTAIGIAEAKLQQKDDSYTIAFIGDASAENGLSLEAFDYLARRKDLKNLIVLINDNGMAISKNNGPISAKFSKLRNSRFYFRTSNAFGKAMAKHQWSWKVFLWLRGVKDHLKRLFLQPTIYESAGLKYIGPYDGQDFDSLDLAFEKAAVVSRKEPVVLHILTHKGFGYGPSQNDEEGSYHGVGKDFDTRASILPKLPDFAALKGEILYQKMGEDKKMQIISPAMELNSGLGKAFKAYPERSFDCGIAEENAVLLASGLALKGMHPVVDVYSTFLQRSYDEIIENVSRQHVSVLFLVDRAGLVGEDGSSHQGIYDVAFCKTIPHSHVYMPYCASQIQELMNFSFEEEGPTFLRFSKGVPAKVEKELPLLGDNSYAVLSKRNTKKLVLAIGRYGYEVEAALNPERYSRVMLVNLLPEDKILEEIGLLSYEEIALYDPYSTKDGTASVLSEYLVSHGYKGKFTCFAFPRKFVPFGQISDLLKQEKLDPISVLEELEKENTHD